jgi:hypothetical protein
MKERNLFTTEWKPHRDNILIEGKYIVVTSGKYKGQEQHISSHYEDEMENLRDTIYSLLLLKEDKKRPTYVKKVDENLYEFGYEDLKEPWWVKN